MGSVRNTEKPLSFPFGPQTRIQSFLLAGQGEPLGEPWMGLGTDVGRPPAWAASPRWGLSVPAALLLTPGLPWVNRTQTGSPSPGLDPMLLLNGCAALSVSPSSCHLCPLTKLPRSSEEELRSLSAT